MQNVFSKKIGVVQEKKWHYESYENLEIFNVINMEDGLIFIINDA